MPNDRDNWDDWWKSRFPRTAPLNAEGGIKPRTRRGSFAGKWWGQRWIQVLDRFQISGRLARARSYARKGQVLSLEISKGLITATVQGSRPSPYEVTIRFQQLDEAEWLSIVEVLNEETYFSARLLAGELPPEMEDLFKKKGFLLFPGGNRDLQTECSCPDSSNPCKHIAAVYYLLAEEFDRDPFLILKLRGRTREELIESLTAVPAAEACEPPKDESIVIKPESLAVDPNRFWRNKASVELTGSLRSIPDKATLLRRLGGFPFWQGRATIEEELERVYGAAADRWLFFFQERLARGNDDG